MALPSSAGKVKETSLDIAAGFKVSVLVPSSLSSFKIIDPPLVAPLPTVKFAFAKTLLLAVMVVNAPVDAEFAPIAAPSIAPPSISTASKLAVPSMYKSLNSTELLPRSTSLSSDADHAVMSPLPIVTVLSPFPIAPYPITI